LLRQYLPKGSDLSVHSQQPLDDIAWKLNTRPSKSLGCKCPAEPLLPEDTFDFKTYWADEVQSDFSWEKFQGSNYARQCPAEPFLPEDAFDFKSYWADEIQSLIFPGKNFKEVIMLAMARVLLSF
jgi:hypothetical protein